MTTTDFNVEDNAKYLASGMFYLGFGERHTAEMVEKIKGNEASFQINHSATSDKKEMDYNLDFKKAADSDWVNLTGYRATLKEDPAKTQYFSVYKNNGITAKEAFNMLQGRAICKTRTTHEIKFDTWHKLDMDRKTKSGNFVEKTFNKDLRFSLDRALDKMPWSQSEGKQRPYWVAEDLRKGNPLQGTLSKNGQDVEVQIIVLPDLGEVRGYDKAGAVVAIASGLSERELSKKEAADTTEKIAPDTTEATGQSLNKQEKTEQQNNPVTESIKNDPAQKINNGQQQQEKDTIQRIPPRTHPPLESNSQSKGKAK